MPAPFFQQWSRIPMFHLKIGSLFPQFTSYCSLVACLVCTLTNCAWENSEAEISPSRSRAKQSPVGRSMGGTGQEAPSGAHPCVVLQPTFILVGAETPAFMHGEEVPPAHMSGEGQTSGVQATAGLVCLTHTPFSFRIALPAGGPFEEKARKLLPDFRPPCRRTGPIPLRDCISGRGPRPSASAWRGAGWTRGHPHVLLRLPWLVAHGFLFFSPIHSWLGGPGHP